MTTDPRLALVGRLSAACGDEIRARDPASAMPWASVPTVAAMTAHLGGVQRWVVQVLRTRRAAPQATPPGAASAEWYEQGRIALLDELAAVPADAPCWVLGGRTGTAAFWRRRMVFEHAKHLIDLRAADGGAWAVAPELGADDYADGVDELLTEFLPRSRRSLTPLPGAVVLRTAETGRAWRIAEDWTVADGSPREAAVVTAPAGELALMLWERADLLRPGSRAEVSGSREAVALLQAAPIHPW